MVRGQNDIQYRLKGVWPLIERSHWRRFPVKSPYKLRELSMAGQEIVSAIHNRFSRIQQDALTFSAGRCERHLWFSKMTDIDEPIDKRRRSWKSLFYPGLMIRYMPNKLDKDVRAGRIC